MPPVTELRSRFRSRAQLVYSLAALAGVATFGTVGFHLVEGWSLSDALYMTVMTVTTVGYGPPKELSPAGRDFATVFMVIGVGTAGYLLSTAVQSLVRFEILAAYGARRRAREMSKIRDHYIICGAGRVGKRIVREMRLAGVPFVVVESNALLAGELGLPDTQVLIRDATLDETLEEAGVARARARRVPRRRRGESLRRAHRPHAKPGHAHRLARGRRVGRAEAHTRGREPRHRAHHHRQPPHGAGPTQTRGRGLHGLGRDRGARPRLRAVRSQRSLDARGP